LSTRNAVVSSWRVRRKSSGFRFGAEKGHRADVEVKRTGRLLQHLISRNRRAGADHRDEQRLAEVRLSAGNAIQAV
jgi:hypothetical protein